MTAAMTKDQSKIDDARRVAQAIRAAARKNGDLIEFDASFEIAAELLKSCATVEDAIHFAARPYVIGGRCSW